MRASPPWFAQWDSDRKPLPPSARCSRPLPDPLPPLPPPVQETLNNLRKAMENTKIMCAVMLDTKVRFSCCPSRCGGEILRR